MVDVASDEGSAVEVTLPISFVEAAEVEGDVTVMGALCGVLGSVTLDKTRSKMCITPLLTRKSDLMMFAVTPLRVTLYDWASGLTVNV